MGSIFSITRIDELKVEGIVMCRVVPSNHEIDKCGDQLIRNSVPRGDISGDDESKTDLFVQFMELRSLAEQLGDPRLCDCRKASAKQSPLPKQVV